MPAKHIYNDDGTVELSWYFDDKLHRDNDKPAYMKYDKFTSIPIDHKYFQYGNLHRDNDKPAVLEYDYKGDTKHAKYFVYNHQHRDNNKPSSETL